jgi:membrane protease YdiL (CAAX protease family)
MTGAIAAEKHNVLRNILVVIIGIVPIYTYLLWSYYTRGEEYTISDMLLYPLVIGGVWIIMLLVLYRYYSGKRLALLNRRVGVWWKDIVMGIVLSAGLLVLFFLQQHFFNPLFQQQPPPHAIIELLGGLVRNWLLLALWLGPVVWIGVACFEELLRVFMLDLLWDVASSAFSIWLVLILSAVLFAVAHIYQGTANMIGIFVLAIVYGVFYLKVGRIWPMIIAHGLYDSLQVVMAVVQIRQAIG